MMGQYILEGKVPVPCDDIITWGRWFETANRRVAKSMIGDVEVSTVFLGLDHSFGSGPPILFETMIFGGEHDQDQWRCSTWEEAEKQHAAAIALVQLPMSEMELPKRREENEADRISHD